MLVLSHPSPSLGLNPLLLARDYITCDSNSIWLLPRTTANLNSEEHPIFKLIIVLVPRNRRNIEGDEETTTGVDGGETQQWSSCLPGEECACVSKYIVEDKLGKKFEYSWDHQEEEEEVAGMDGP